MPVAELLFWPALLAYGEAAVAYAGDARRPGVYGRLATWGVRVGWLIQTALLVVQATRAERFPWDTWAGALNLFVWLVVGAYLVWGCRPGYRLLGLVVMPPVVALLALSYAAGGLDADGGGGASTLFLVLHVGLVLAAFAGFALAAALAGLYLWEERRLKSRRRASGLLGRTPPLGTLDALTGKTIAVALPLLTVGMAVGFLQGAELDLEVGATVGAWGAYAAFLVLRGSGRRGRRSAYLALAGFAVVLAATLGLGLVHD